MALLVLFLFCLLLVGTLLTGHSLLWALGAGYCLFAGYCLSCRLSPGRVFRASLEGIRTVLPILTTFVCIGMLTASWRASGTIAYLVDCSLQLMTPALFLPCAFLANCGLSYLLGSSFATAATMGVISMSVGMALNQPPLLTGGAILSGIYFGDRCSPMSTSALLVSTVTKTNIYANCRTMWATGWPALLASVAAYATGALLLHAEGTIPDTGALFAREYTLNVLTALPALLILVLALCKIHVRTAMLVSTLCALGLCLLLQGTNPADIPGLLLCGYTARDPEVGRLFDGGGISSMLTVAGIVCISSTYAGLFQASDLLHDLKAFLHKRAGRPGSFTGFALAGLVTSAIACNQTLAVLLTWQVTKDLEPDPARLASNLEDSVILLSALVPWSIACVIPLSMLQAPHSAVLAACYLWLVPLSRLILPAPVLTRRS